MSVAEQIVALEAAIQTGAVSVTDENGRTVNLGTHAQKLEALAALRNRQQETSAGRAFAISPLKSPGPRG